MRKQLINICYVLRLVLCCDIFLIYCALISNVILILIRQFSRCTRISYDCIASRLKAGMNINKSQQRKSLFSSFLFIKFEIRAMKRFSSETYKEGLLYGGKKYICVADGIIKAFPF